MYEYNLGIRFQRIAIERAHHTALWFDEDGVSFEELNALANRIARLFIEKGLKSGDVVCISGQKSIAAFASMLACLKLGVIYSVFDYDSPAERLRRIISTCNPRLVIGDPALELGETLIVDGGSLTTTTAEFEDSNLTETDIVIGSDPAYIMFTSGSTGFPKGAVMSHQNVLNLIQWSASTFSITTDDVLTNVNPLYFDNSVFDFYASLFNGAALVPFSKEETQEPQRLVAKIDAHACSVWFSVPSLLMFLQTMRATDGNHLRSITRFIFGGEGYPKAKLKGLFDAYSATSELFNVYGPTECTCICSCYKITASDFEDLNGLPPLGHIADNFKFLILDDDENCVAEGTTGELCLLGPNVGKGYYNAAELTANSFKQNPLNKTTGELMYKTGDLVKLNPLDGKLWIQGRKDNQIKHMGYRIELEEIESALHRLGYVVEAAALHTQVNGLSRIVAVVATADEIDAAVIRRDLRQFIPDYMIPHTFYREGVLPKNSSGKVDRLALSNKYTATLSAASP